jgi:hypothetical protein
MAKVSARGSYEVAKVTAERAHDDEERPYTYRYAFVYRSDGAVLNRLVSSQEGDGKRDVRISSGYSVFAKFQTPIPDGSTARDRLATALARRGYSVISEETLRAEEHDRRRYDACPGSGKVAGNIEQTSWDIGPKFGGRLWSTCPDCQRGVKPVRNRYSGGRWVLPRHKPRDY